jgi:penicillin-binding protein 1A
MVDQGRISAEEARAAVRRGLRPGLLPEFKIQAQAFAEWVAQSWGPSHVQQGETVRFFVTIEPRFQHHVERSLSELVSEGAIPDAYEAAAVMMDPAGRVRAMVGSTDWASRRFNSAVKGRVQPGSTAKLPLLVAACEAGLMPESRIVDLPITPGWPANGSVGYRGETTLKEAAARSRNAAAVRLTRELGVDTVAKTARRLGIEPGPDPDPAFVLGTFSTNVLTMTSAYAAVANGGFKAEPSGVLAVVDGRGEVRANLIDTTRTRVVPQRCIEPTRSILHEVVRGGTGSGAALKGWKAYGKTGTTSGNADAWFVGWSEGRVLGVWMGKRRDAESLALAGGGAPAALFKRVSSRVNALVAERERREQEARRVASGQDDSRTKVSADPLPRPKGDARPAARTSGSPLPPARPQT